MELLLREPLGDRSLVAGDLPLSIGGTGADLVIAGVVEGPLAWVGLQEDQLFLQPRDAAAPVLLNGARITASAWLRSGDVLDVGAGRLKYRVDDGRRLLEVVAGGADNVTAPPVADTPGSVAGSGADEGAAIEPVAFRRAPTAPAPAVRGAGRRRAALALGLAALAAVAALVFTSASVLVDVEPAADRVVFEGRWPGVRLGTSHLLRPGKYTLVAERAGYEVLRVPVEVTRERGRRLELRLVPLPGRLRVVLPVPGEVRIDGTVAGKAPGEFTLRAGKHAIAIDTERYLDFATEVQIEGLGRLQVLEPRLTPGWAAVQISSEPAGAEVRVDGEVQGKTPRGFELMAGSHRIELHLAGFKPWVSDVQAVANEPLGIGPVRLGLPDGRLVVRSNPAGASVTVGGAYRGRTPLEVDVSPDLEHLVAVARDGYESATRSARVAPGGRVTVEVSLEAILGEVIVRANPADARLLVDGTDRGTASQTLRLPSTAHAIEIRKPGYVPHRTTVTPRPGLAQNLEVTLLPGIPAVPSTAATAAGTTAAQGAVEGMIALPPVLRTKTGQELKLVPAGSFTMGSPRREAGRRANEAQRAVRLERRFYVAPREITNAEFRRFRSSHRSGFILQTTLDLDALPVVNVSWQDAAAYCNWLSTEEGLTPAYENRGGKLVPVVPVTNGYRLPTEAEWEWIARGADGVMRKYPWGDTLPVPAGAGNFADRNAQPLVATFLPDLDDGYAATAPVGSFAPNPAGFFDLGGNVAEWAHDVYTVQPASTATAVDPVAAGDGVLRVIRGSSWKHSAVTELRVAFRDYGDGRRNDLGFRIARHAQ